MKVTGFNGSPRKDGNTTALINYLFEELNKEGIETELVQLSENKIHGCISCFKCFEKKNKRCAVTNDAANDCIEKIMQSRGIALASPVYFIDATPEMKALIDRAGFVGLANDKMYTNKIGAALACFRRTGSAHTVDTMNHFFLSNEIIIMGRANSMAMEKGDVNKDEEGIRLAKTLGKRMAWLMKKIGD